MTGDEYEKSYLGSGEALYREKRTSRAVFALISSISGLLGTIGALGIAAGISGDPQGMIAGVGMIGFAALIGVLGVTESVSRVVVAPGELRLGFGIRDTRIALSSIDSTSLGVFDAQVKQKTAADRAQIFGPSKVDDGYVRISWIDASTGKPRVGWIPSDAPEALRSAIDRARGTMGPNVRIATDEVAAAAIEDADLDADLAAERRGGSAER